MTFINVSSCLTPCAPLMSVFKGSVSSVVLVCQLCSPSQGWHNVCFISVCVCVCLSLDEYFKMVCGGGKEEKQRAYPIFFFKTT